MERSTGSDDEHMEGIGLALHVAVCAGVGMSVHGIWQGGCERPVSWPRWC